MHLILNVVLSERFCLIPEQSRALRLLEEKKKNEMGLSRQSVYVPTQTYSLQSRCRRPSRPLTASPAYQTTTSAMRKSTFIEAAG